MDTGSMDTEGMDTQDLIKDALRLRAEQAPPEGNVLAALHRPGRSRRPLFPAITAATGAVAIAAVAVVATSSLRPVADAPPAGQGTDTRPPAPATTAASTTPAVPQTFGYAPTWIPEGLVERNRSFDPERETLRGWSHHTPNGQSGTPMMSLRIPHPEDAKRALRQEIVNAPAGDRVEVDGKPAVITDPAEDTTVPDARVVLNPAPDVYVELTVLNAPDVRTTALRVAESLRPDPTPSRTPLSIGGSVAFHAGTTGEGTWGVATTGEIDGVGFSANLSNRIAPPLKGGPGVAPVAVTARGVPAEYIGEQNGYLRIDLGPNLHLLVGGNGPHTESAEALIAAAEAIVVDPNPDMSWATG